MSIYHKHHIVPRHLGGTDDPSNLVKLTVQEHAEAHRKLFEQYGRWQDELAWKGLAKMIDRQEIIKKQLMMAGKTSLGHKRWLGKKHSQESKIKISQKSTIHQKGEGNSQYGTMWIHNPNLMINKKIKKETPIPEGWIRGRKMVRDQGFEPRLSGSKPDDLPLI